MAEDNANKNEFKDLEKMIREELPKEVDELEIIIAHRLIGFAKKLYDENKKIDKESALGLAQEIAEDLLRAYWTKMGKGKEEIEKDLKNKQYVKYEVYKIFGLRIGEFAEDILNGNLNLGRVNALTKKVSEQYAGMLRELVILPYLDDRDMKNRAVEYIKSEFKSQKINVKDPELIKEQKYFTRHFLDVLSGAHRQPEEYVKNFHYLEHRKDEKKEGK